MKEYSFFFFFSLNLLCTDEIDLFWGGEGIEKAEVEPRPSIYFTHTQLDSILYLQLVHCFHSPTPQSPRRLRFVWKLLNSSILQVLNWDFFLVSFLYIDLHSSQSIFLSLSSSPFFFFQFLPLYGFVYIRHRSTSPLSLSLYIYIHIYIYAYGYV